MDEQLEALTKIIKMLEPFDTDTQARIVATVRLLLDIPHIKHTISE